MKKILVTSGCSFTHDFPTRAHHLAVHKDMTLANVAMSGCGNHVISTELIRKIELLLKSGISHDDLFVVVQWSGLFRFDFVVDKNYHKNPVRPVHLANGKPGEKKRAFSAPEDTTNQWIMSAGSKDKSIWPEYYLMASKEQAFVETIEQILRVQWYLKSKNIKYKMFTGWDIFTDGKANIVGTDKILKTNQFTDENYSSIDNELLADNCKWFGYLFDLIDFDNFWFFNDDKIKFGGMLQWMKRNVPLYQRYIRPGDFHPSLVSHKRFAIEVLSEML